MNLVLRFDVSAIPALAEMRAQRDWEILAEESRVWIRVADSPETREAALALPAEARFTERAAGLLTPLGATLPVQAVPEGAWRQLADVLTVRAPQTILPGVANAECAIELCESEEAQTASALMAKWDDFATWAREAPAIRLARLKIIVAADGKTFARGTPLPPIRGEGYYWTGQIAIPCGRALAPHLWPELVAQRLALQTGDSAILHEDGTIDVIREDHWADVSRSSVELTSRSLRSLTTA